jgi:thiol:disulfide interchange protein DsbD
MFILGVKMKFYISLLMFFTVTFNIFAIENVTANTKDAKIVVSSVQKKVEAKQLYQTDVKPDVITNEVKDDGIMSNGLFWAFLIVFIGGFLTSLTPCAFPIILISMPSLMKKEGSKKYKFSISLVYVLGIATMYSALGIFAALSGSAIGALMQNPWVIGGFILFFIAMALSSLGAFILQMPSGMTTKMTGASEGSGYPKAYISGLFLGIIAAPCVGPVLAGVLAYIAQTRDVMLGFLLLTTFAFGMGVLILIIGTFSPKWKSGSWMEKVNTIFGILLFFAAFYFLKDVLPVVNSPFNMLYESLGFNTIIFSIISLGVVVVGYFIGPFKFEEMFMIEPIEKLRKLFGAVVIAIGLFMLAGVFLFFKTETKFHWEKPNLAMIKDDANFKKLGIPKLLIEKAKKEKKGIMIDFSGQGCAACAELKRHTFSDEEVAIHIKENFVPIYLYYTDSDEDEKVYAPMDDAFKVAYQWPTVIFIDKAGRLRPDLTLKGFEKADKFLKRMKKVQ